MIVPRYWAEGRVQHRDKDRQVTVRRFGWSNDSLQDAQTMADARAAEALHEILGGKKLLRREPKVPYNGAAGVPIREEIIGEFGDTIITRNAYGALCLNTPNVLFGDIDDSSLPYRVREFVVWLWGVGCIPLAFWISFGLTMVVMIVGIIVLGFIWGIVRRIYRVKNARERESSIDRIHQFIEKRPNWNLRIYVTPAGWRLLATHRLFSPTEEETAEFFSELKVDPIYRRMCERQNCFRARVSPKPWRIGIKKHMRPRPGRWPINPALMPLRQAWVEEYQQRAKDFASCRFIETIGSGIIHPDVAPVLLVHDELCQSQTDLPIA